METRDTLYLVDGSNFLFRAYHALPPMTTRAGTPTGAVFGIGNMLERLIADHHPAYLAVIFDAGGRSGRSELYAPYKANRRETPPDLAPQFELARRLIRARGIRVLDARDVEADDLIATLARRAAAEGMRVVIVSSDKDLMQLCGDAIVLFDTMKGGRGSGSSGTQGMTFGPREVEEKFGVPPEQLGDVLALMGDSSDNIPGVPGVGPKTAAQLIRDFGSLDELLRRIDDIQGRGADRLKAALRENLEQLRVSRRLVTLDERVPVPVGLADLRRKEPLGAEEMKELTALLQELEFQRLLDRFRAQAAGAAPAPVSATPAPASADGAPQVQPLLPPVVVGTAAEVRALAQGLAGARAGLALSIQLAGPAQPQSARVAPVCGLAVYAPGVTAAPAYLPLGHRYLGMTPQLAREEVAAALGPLLADPALPKFVHGAKDAHLALCGLGIPLAGVRADPALCSYLLDAAADHSLGALAQRFLGVAEPRLREQLCQGGRRSALLETCEVQPVAELAAFEAQATLRLAPLLLARLDAAALALLEDMELPLAQVLAVIERHGIVLDTSVLRRLSVEVDEKLHALEAEIQKEAGYEVNIGSPKQLAELLFEKLMLPPVKKTKTGLSTDAEVLETLAAQHPIARKIHEHRGLAKLKNTYIDQLPALVEPTTGRLHTSYNQVVAATGRLSSTEPNLQNIPIRTELGRRIRRAFIAPPGHVLIAADYSQIELRVLAHLSGDPLLLESFHKGEDVHERTAIEMFGPEAGRRPEMRRAAKMINYGIVYGLSDYGLAVRLSIERSVAKTYIQEYFARYSGVQRFMEELVQKARSEGGARTLLGRFRPLPEINARNYQVRAYAERMAKNTPLQGTAADILKRAMIDVERLLEAEADRLHARMLLTVHDELVLEAPREHAAEVQARVKDAMEKAFTLAVPLKVDVGSGDNWADCD